MGEMSIPDSAYAFAAASGAERKADNNERVIKQLTALVKRLDLRVQALEERSRLYPWADNR